MQCVWKMRTRILLKSGAHMVRGESVKNNTAYIIPCQKSGPFYVEWWKNYLVVKRAHACSVCGKWELEFCLKVEHTWYWSGGVCEKSVAFSLSICEGGRGNKEAAWRPALITKPGGCSQTAECLQMWLLFSYNLSTRQQSVCRCGCSSPTICQPDSRVIVDVAALLL